MLENLQNSNIFCIFAHYYQYYKDVKGFIRDDI